MNETPFLNIRKIPALLAVKKGTYSPEKMKDMHFSLNYFPNSRTPVNSPIIILEGFMQLDLWLPYRSAAKRHEFSKGPFMANRLARPHLHSE